MKGLIGYISILGFILFILVAIGMGIGDPPKKSIKDEYPTSEVAFIETVSDAMSKNTSANKLQKEKIKTIRDNNICDILSRTKNIEHWKGAVSEIDSTNDGNAIISIAIPYGIVLGTWNNSFSDRNSHTIIKKDTPLFESVYNLHVGDTVIFSGKFVESKHQCAWESSVTLDGGLSDPEFVFNFSNIKSA